MSSSEEKFVPISKLIWPIKTQNNEVTSNNYTFEPIELPLSSSSLSCSFQFHRKPIATSLLINSSTAMSSYSPSDYSYESHFGCSPSVSLISNEKPDNSYPSSMQNNSDSESCI